MEGLMELGADQTTILPDLQVLTGILFDKI